MHAKSRLPLIALAGAALIGAFLAVRPSVGPSPQPAVAAEVGAAADPGALAPFLRFSGTGTVTVKPDIASISASAQATADSSAKALEDASARMERVIAKMKELGIAEDDLRTDQASTYQDYESKRWTAQQSLTITVREIDRAGEILTAANAAGAQNVNGPGFSVEDQSAAYREAIGRAMADARAKAEAAAAQMGVRVLGVVSVDETGGSQPPIMYDRAAAESAAGDGGGAVPIQQGTLDVVMSLVVVFQYGQ